MDEKRLLWVRVEKYVPTILNYQTDLPSQGLSVMNATSSIQ